MSVDKLVDSTKLDACCTAEANAIRAKTGGSSQIAYDWANDKGFADAIAAIPTGGGDPYENLVKTNNNTLVSCDESLSSVRAYMFYGNTQLAQFDFSNTTSIHPGAFYNTGLTGAIMLPKKIVNLGNSAFRGCSKVTSFVFPQEVMRLDVSLFESCSRLETVDVNTVTLSIDGRAFFNTGAITALIIRQTSGVVSLVYPFPNTSALSTAIGTANIYVPSSLVASYKSASNWSSYSDRILAIENSYYETHYGDGSLIPTT